MNRKTIDEYLAAIGYPIEDLTELDCLAIAAVVHDARIYGNGYLQRGHAGTEETDLHRLDPRRVRVFQS